MNCRNRPDRDRPAAQTFEIDHLGAFDVDRVQFLGGERDELAATIDIFHVGTHGVSPGTDGSNPSPSSGESRPKIFGASSIKRLSLIDRFGVRRTMALSPNSAARRAASEAFTDAVFGVPTVNDILQEL